MQRRIFGRCLTAVLITACAGRAHTNEPAPVTIGDYWTVRCRTGAATVRPLPFVLTLGGDFGGAVREVMDVLQGLGYQAESHIPAVWHTLPRTAWRAGPATDSLRAHSYPGTAISLVMGEKEGSPALLGLVYALCQSDRGVPDSVSVAAQRQEADRIVANVRHRGAH